MKLECGLTSERGTAREVSEVTEVTEVCEVLPMKMDET